MALTLLDLREARAALPRNEVISTSQGLEAFLSLGTRETWAGLSLTTEQAMEYGPLDIAVRVLSEGISQLPFNILKRGAEDEREREIDNSFHIQKLFRRPNGWQTGIELRDLAIRRACTTGDFFALVNRNSRSGEIRELLPVDPKRVQVVQNKDWSLTYKIQQQNGAAREFAQREIFHFRGPSDDGVRGIDLIYRHRNAIALGIVQDRAAANLFSKGALLSGAFSIPGSLTEKQFERMTEQLRKQFSGENANSIALLEGGADFKSMMMTSEASQLLDSRKLQRGIVAAFLRVPLHMVGDYERATFSNIENLARQAVDWTFMPWLVRFESAIEQQLMTAEERETYFAKHNVNALLRGTAKERYDLYAVGIQNGIINPNEARDKEDLSPREGGDEYMPAENLFGKPEKGDKGDGTEKPVA